MQFWAKACRVLMWLALLVCGFFQWCGIAGILINNGKSDDPYTVWPLMAAMVMLTVATVWFTLNTGFAKRHRLWGVLAAGLASVVIFVVALDLWQTFDAAAVMSGGLTLGTLIWRHMSSIAVFLFMLVAHILEQAAPRETADEGETPFSAVLAEIDRENAKK